MHAHGTPVTIFSDCHHLVHEAHRSAEWGELGREIGSENKVDAGRIRSDTGCNCRLARAVGRQHVLSSDALACCAQVPRLGHLLREARHFVGRQGFPCLAVPGSNSSAAPNSASNAIVGVRIALALPYRLIFERKDLGIKCRKRHQQGR